MRLAFLSDVHGNLPALEATLAAVSAARADRLVVGGDVFPGPLGAECLPRLAEVDVPLRYLSGNGERETLAAVDGQIAQARPDVNFLGIEVFGAGVGALARRVDLLGLGNVRIVQHDAVEVVRDMIAPSALAGAPVFFPDPRPKARHHKRRLIAQGFVGLLASRIATGGTLHCATDWQQYAEQMLAVLPAEPLLRNLHEGYAPLPANPFATRPTTKFHARGERLGHGVWDLVFERR